jgi:hypothetical protein
MFFEGENRGFALPTLVSTWVAKPEVHAEVRVPRKTVRKTPWEDVLQAPVSAMVFVPGRM